MYLFKKTKSLSSKMIASLLTAITVEVKPDNLRTKLFWPNDSIPKI